MKFLLTQRMKISERKPHDMGVICGVTTNPSLIAKEGRFQGSHQRDHNDR